ncbi:Vacuolar Protein Sorting-Associated Protein 13D [Manis pentadactyla]|nr:Vacuolar Protein Sorting-Associated Protein 13D [Manis pentadactyla]
MIESSVAFVTEYPLNNYLQLMFIIGQEIESTSHKLVLGIVSDSAGSGTNCGCLMLLIGLSEPPLDCQLLEVPYFLSGGLLFQKTFEGMAS